mmetsp:Transcript_64487/g.76372  ORF Transcript_64487/g.76372 Transcript_64487/m.76372 type:complete len:158 (+) Transcript_64487:54-527(+)|eukprot:CAMPEP_0172505600 /NCGR_PEP_ID=MMETSP1066-20121228/187662_1 /TAXON_ID=671091 /ORGANISM="Coscinodiscus wailesii, Strain CCMP2513" /LENGTH=157 /DNA_ID=CAMNT_0013282277 /DNA_START=46 /DNA_END=519 /DNA_ORIENTATION=+
MTRLSSLNFLLIVLSSASNAEADEMGFYESEQTAFASVDVNEDGRLSKDEFRELLTNEYIEDRKSFTESNLELLRDIGVETSFEKMDLDGDGILQDDEVFHATQDYLVSSGEVEELFGSYDNNRDNFITWDEFFEPDEVMDDDDTNMTYENENDEEF